MSKRIAIAAAVVCAAGTVAGFGAAGVGAHASKAGRPDSGKLYISVNRSVGPVLYASGTNQDRVLGAGAVTAKYTLTAAKGGGETLTSKHTVLYTPTGSLTGTSSAHLVLSAGGKETFSNGKLDLRLGRGSQKGHSFVGTFSGSGSSTSNQNTITYRGTYK